MNHPSSLPSRRPVLSATLAPPVTARFGTGAQASAFVRLPVSRRVSSLHLKPRWILSLGLQHHL
jgi:hypothetical protein